MRRFARVLVEKRDHNVQTGRDASNHNSTLQIIRSVNLVDLAWQSSETQFRFTQCPDGRALHLQRSESQVRSPGHIGHHSRACLGPFRIGDNIIKTIHTHEAGHHLIANPTFHRRYVCVGQTLGSPPIDDRLMSEAMVYIMGKGMPWRHLPARFGN
ncbi:MAG: hypothetical protein CMO80_14025 [Verrucomicrobiales bacterium]|nr:hypothetical protein [Verrucomicrobiales bacterium]